MSHCSDDDTLSIFRIVGYPERNEFSVVDLKLQSAGSYIIASKPTAVLELRYIYVDFFSVRSILIICKLNALAPMLRGRTGREYSEENTKMIAVLDFS